MNRTLIGLAECSDETCRDRGCMPRGRRQRPRQQESSYRRIDLRRFRAAQPTVADTMSFPSKLQYRWRNARRFRGLTASRRATCSICRSDFRRHPTRGQVPLLHSQLIVALEGQILKAYRSTGTACVDRSWRVRSRPNVKFRRAMAGSVTLADKKIDSSNDAAVPSSSKAVAMQVSLI